MNSGDTCECGGAIMVDPDTNIRSCMNGHVYIGDGHGGTRPITDEGELSVYRRYKAALEACRIVLETAGPRVRAAFKFVATPEAEAVYADGARKAQVYIDLEDQRRNAHLPVDENAYCEAVDALRLARAAVEAAQAERAFVETFPAVRRGSNPPGDSAP
jgi:hypothetical protein